MLKSSIPSRFGLGFCFLSLLAISMNIHFPFISHQPVSKWPENGWIWIFHVLIPAFPEPGPIGSTTEIIPDWTGWEFHLINLIKRGKLSSAFHHPPDFATGWSQSSRSVWKTLPGIGWNCWGVLGRTRIGTGWSLWNFQSRIFHDSLITSAVAEVSRSWLWMIRNFEGSPLSAGISSMDLHPAPNPTRAGFGEGKLWNVGLGIRSRMWGEKAGMIWRWNDTSTAVEECLSSVRKEKQE